MSGEGPWGIVAYGLQAPQERLIPTYLPLRAKQERLQAMREWEARQREQARHAETVFVQAAADWAEVRARYVDSSIAQTVLDIHAPVLHGADVVCGGCVSLDEYGDPHDTWACDTFIAIRECG